MRGVITSLTDAEAALSLLDSAMGYPMIGATLAGVPDPAHPTLHYTDTITNPVTGVSAIPLDITLESMGVQLVNDPDGAGGFAPQLTGAARATLLAAYQSAVTLDDTWFPRVRAIGGA